LIFISPRRSNCCFYSCFRNHYCSSASHVWNNKASQLFRVRMIFHCNTEPTRR
jgi:hypothetical protein